MGLNLLRTGTSAGYGLVDIGTEYADQSKGLTKPFQNITDYQRLLATVGGAVGAYMSFGRSAEIFETVELASIPLLEKSIANLIESKMGSSTRFKSMTLKRVGQPNLPPVMQPQTIGTAY